MRQYGFIALLAPFALVAFGCEEDPSGSPGGFQLPEGGSGFEIPDSSTTPPDSSAPDAAPTGVTVTVKHEGAPQKDVRVIFHDATGAVTGDFKTDAAGVVSQPVAPSMVTILAPNAEVGTELAPLTYLGVADGDALTIELDGVNVVSKIGEYSVTLGGGFDNAEQYSVRAGDQCSTLGPSDGTLILDLYPSCVGAQGVVLATASAADGTPLAFTFAKNLAKPMGGATITVPALPPFVAAGSLTVTAANVPPNDYAWVEAAALADGRSFDIGPRGGDFPAEPATFRLPVGFGDAHQASMGTYSGMSSRTIVKREPATVTNIAFDFAALLPSLGDSNVAADNPKRPKATWSSSAPLTGTDGGILRLDWYGNRGSLRWSFVLPPGTTEVTAPALPADLSIPALEEAPVDITALAFVEATHLEGYKAFKSMPMPSGDAPEIFWTSSPLPANGTVRTVRYGD